jgi:hypothetical protein
MNCEVWKSIPGYESYYEVSNFGRVRRLPGVRGNGDKWKGRVLKPYNNRGRDMVMLMVNNDIWRVNVHSLVAIAFIGPRPMGYEVNHINGIKSDNRPENLEYVTREENMAHAIAMGLHLRGERHPQFGEIREHSRGEKNRNAKLTEQKVREIRKLHAEGRSMRGLAREHGVTKRAIQQILLGITWKHVV